MTYLLIKAAPFPGSSPRSSRRWRGKAPVPGELIASLPRGAILAMLWLWRDTGDSTRIAPHAEATFWYVLPSLPMFLVVPWLLRAGMAFLPALGLGCILTVALHRCLIWLAPPLGIPL